MNNYPLINFDTESFSFRVYSNNELERKMIEEFNSDISTKEFLSEFLNYIEETKYDLENNFEPQRYTNIIYYESLPIGLITFFDLGNELVFSHGIRPRERGKRFSSRVKKEAFEYTFRNLPEVARIVTYIDKTNTKNLNSLKKIKYDEIEVIVDDINDKEFFKVSHYNPYFEDINKKK